ncbi:hypothetical protein [Bacillus sp. UMB0893]|uniref:hypothetical protein n=1 Tax=Bacillus sp. UMB0893 TaxID=2066053 RepID=UPI0008A9A6B6|nr:hypothetical protein [Bacillus sp. UMB0893]OHR74079.1 hypothetical protein HMPREF3291_00165 [Bacillus sp. HMSC76G11]PLR65623.1 hypothetical protein CYJ36_22500 [Bacillus sp. UMB0893]
MKRVSFSLFPGQAETYKSIVDSSVRSKILRNYVLNEYQLPSDLKIINEGEKKGLKPEPFLFDENTNDRLNELVKNVREAGYKANRSSLMRHIMNQLINKLQKQNNSLPKKREIRHSSFYFEKGTREVLEQFVPFRDRNAAIEIYILEEYTPSHDHALLLDKPEEPEPMRIGMAAEAFRKLDGYVKEIHSKGITRTALMRDVVEQLIGKLSNTDARKLIAEKRLQNALREFENTFGNDVLRERLEEYRGEGKE